MLTEVSYTRHLEDEDNLHYQNDAPLRIEEYKKVPVIAKNILEEKRKSGSTEIVLISSVKRRALQTAEFVADAVATNSTVEIQKDPRIREIDQGKYNLPLEYKPGDHFQPLQVAWLAYIEQVSKYYNLTYRFGSPFVNGELIYPNLQCWERYGECQLEFAGRYYDFLLDLQSQMDRKQTALYAIVTHQALVVRTGELTFLMDDLNKGRVDYQPGKLGLQEWGYLGSAESLCVDFADHGGTGMLNLNAIFENDHFLAEELRYLASINIDI